MEPVSLEFWRQKGNFVILLRLLKRNDESLQ